MPHPAEWTYANIETQANSFKRYGLSFDWSRRLHTSDPEYYRWTQWLFLRFFERGLAYRKASYVNWCPQDQTVLANEQVVAGMCERCGSVVTKRQLTQWYFKITDYADRLLDDMAELEGGWPERVLTMQRNWIGRSEGAYVDFKIATAGQEKPVTVFTTRPDTLYGATFFVVAPDAPLAAEIVADDHRADFEAYLEKTKQTTEIERQSTDRPKTGVFLGVYATNPVNGEQIPVYAADYVLAEYGTGAIMAVPAHDQRDLDFARAYDLPVREVVDTGGPDPASSGVATPGDGTYVNSGPERAHRQGRRGAQDHRPTGVRRRRHRRGHLPAARLAAEPATLLGLPDPDHPLRAVRRGAGARRPTAGGAALSDGHGPGAEGHLTAGRGHRLGERRLPDLRRSGQAGHRHDGHLRRLLVVLLPLLLARLHRRSVRSRRTCAAGCRWRSTSAASSTPSCTCCTCGSSPRCCTTWARSTSSSRCAGC